MALIVVDRSGLCSCNCATKCVVDGRCGSSMRCSKEDIEAKGYETIQVIDTDFITSNTLLYSKNPKDTIFKRYFDTYKSISRTLSMIILIFLFSFLDAICFNSFLKGFGTGFITVIVMDLIFGIGRRSPLFK